MATALVIGSMMADIFLLPTMGAYGGAGALAWVFTAWRAILLADACVAAVCARSAAARRLPSLARDFAASGGLVVLISIWIDLPGHYTVRHLSH